MTKTATVRPNIAEMIFRGSDPKDSADSPHIVTSMENALDGDYLRISWLSSKVESGMAPPTSWVASRILLKEVSICKDGAN